MGLSGTKMDKMTKRTLINLCLTFPGSYEDYPFSDMTRKSTDDDWAVIRHSGNKKCFAFIYEQNSALFVNLKCEPMKSDFLRGVYFCVTPAYHMNKLHWNSVEINKNTPNSLLIELLTDSFNLTRSGQTRKK